MAEILSPFFAAFLIAYLLEPIAKKFNELGLTRTFSSLISILVGITLVCGLVSLVVPILENEFSNLKERLPSMISNGFLYLEPLATQYLNVKLDSVENVKIQLIEWLRNYSDVASKGFLKLMISRTNLFFSLIGWLVLLPVVTFYLHVVSYMCTSRS